jgi:lipopolysaccharide transport system permease protein
MQKILVDIWRHRFALRNLVMKDFRVRYRNMSLGVVWSILNPLVMLGVLVFVFTFIFPQNESQPVFPVFVLLGLVCFNFLSLCINTSTTCIVDHASLVKKVIFPRQVLPLAVVLSQSIHVLIQLGLTFVFILIFGVPISLTYLWIPVILLIELIFVIGAGMAFSALNVFFRDVRYLVESVLAVMFWLSPVFYSLSTVRSNSPKWLYGVYLMNPLAGFIDGMRQAVLNSANPDPISLAVAFGVSVITLIIGLYIFNRMEKVFADLI